MKIQTKLRGSIIIFIITMSFVIIFLVSQTQSTHRKIELINIMDRCVQNLFILQSLTAEYADYGIDRAAQQWQQVYKKLGDDINLLQEHNPLQHYYLEQIRTQYNSVGLLFDEIQAMGTGTPLAQSSVAFKHQRQLITQVSISQSVIMSNIEHWYQGFYDNLIQKYQVVSAILLGITFFIITLIFANFIMLNRSVLKPIQALQHGIQQISQGKQTERIPIRSADEFGALAESFNHMVEQLDQTIRARDQLKEEVERRRSAENDLRRYEHIANNMQSGLFVYQLVDIHDAKSLRMTTVNEAALQLTGTSENELVGRTIGDCFPRLLDTPIPETYAQLARDGTCADLGEIEYTDERRPSTWYSVRAFGLPNHHVGVLFEDISAKKEDEIQIRHAQKMQSVGQLAAGIAHEINTPIQFVGDNLQFLNESVCCLCELIEKFSHIFSDPTLFKDTFEHPEQIAAMKDDADLEFMSLEIPKAIGQSLDGIGRVGNIVRAMKDFAHQGDAEFALADINKAIQNTLIISRNEWKYVANMRTDLDEHLPLIFCNQSSISQVLLNLIVNAAHAIEEKLGADTAEKGRITITTTVEDHVAHISITDTGNGIPEHAQARIFDPFFTTKEVGKGTGQGLALAHTIIVDQHKGALTFETIEGEGTTFHIKLPIEQSNT